MEDGISVKAADVEAHGHVDLDLKMPHSEIHCVDNEQNQESMALLGSTRGAEPSFDLFRSSEDVPSLHLQNNDP